MDFLEINKTKKIKINFRKEIYLNHVPDNNTIIGSYIIVAVIVIPHFDVIMSDNKR